MEIGYKPGKQCIYDVKPATNTQIGMSNYDIQLEEDKHLKAISVLNMIKQSNNKITNTLLSPYYEVFGTQSERIAQVENQRKVTNRLINYYTRNYGN